MPGGYPAVVTQSGLCRRPAPMPQRSEQSAEKAQRSQVVQQQALYLGGLHAQKGAKSNVLQGKCYLVQKCSSTSVAIELFTVPQKVG